MRKKNGHASKMPSDIHKAKTIHTIKPHLNTFNNKTPKHVS